MEYPEPGVMLDSVFVLRGKKPPEACSSSANASRGILPSNGLSRLDWMGLSCHEFKDSAVRLALFVLAYNVGNLLRRLVLPTEMATWSLTSLKERVIKVGARLVKHARRLIFQMAEVSLTSGILAPILERIRRLEPAPG